MGRNDRSRGGLGEDLETEIEAVVRAADCEIYHLDFSHGTLRIFLDRPDGSVTLDHCQNVSKQVSTLLDVHDFGEKKYILEVSSPGLDRQLYRPEDYRRFLGKLARITFLGGEERKKRTVVGRLEGFDPEHEVVTLTEEEAGRDHRIPLDDVQVARLEIEL